jgi:hypothetical protein
MRRFKSPGHAQRFLSAYGPISDHFRPKRHRLRAAEYRARMQDRFQVWKKGTEMKTAAECSTILRQSVALVLPILFFSEKLFISLNKLTIPYKAEKAEYQADAAACNACPLKAECTPALLAGRSIAPFMLTISKESKDIIRPKRIREHCASEKCGSSPYLERPKSGMGCDAFV